MAQSGDNGCVWQQQPSAEWEKQFQSQCLQSPALKSDSSANFLGIGWHRHYFLKFTEVIRQGVPMYDRQVKAIDPAAGFTYFTVLLCLVVAASTALLHAAVLPLLLRSRFFARG
jgi:hypothetical protein